MSNRARAKLPELMIVTQVVKVAPVVARTAGMRFVDLLVTIQVEACEIASIVACAAWLIPLTLRADFLHTSIYLQQVSEYVPRHILLRLFGVLGAYQLTALLLGGVPSAFIKNGDSLRRWMIARQAGVLLAIVVWGFIATLMSQIAVTPGSVIYSGVTAASVWGYLRLSLLVKVEEEVSNYRATELSAATIP